MASKGYAYFGVLLAGGFGVMTMYSTLQPELQKQKDEAHGIFKTEHAGTPDPAKSAEAAATTAVRSKDNTISEAILSDLREAKAGAQSKVIGSGGKKGPLWGLREAIWGKSDAAPAAKGKAVQQIEPLAAGVSVPLAEAEKEKSSAGPAVGKEGAKDEKV